MTSDSIQADTHGDLEQAVERAWEERDSLNSATTGAHREAVEAGLELLDSGKRRAAEKGPDGVWRANEWLKKAVLLSFRLNDMERISGGPGGAGCDRAVGTAEPLRRGRVARGQEPHDRCGVPGNEQLDTRADRIGRDAAADQPKGDERAPVGGVVAQQA